MFDRKKIEQAKGFITSRDRSRANDGKSIECLTLPSFRTFLLKWFSRWDCVAAPFPRDQILQVADSRPNWRRVIVDNRSFSFPMSRHTDFPPMHSNQSFIDRPATSRDKWAGSSGPFDAPPRLKKKVDVKSKTKIHFLPPNQSPAFRKNWRRIFWLERSEEEEKVKINRG